MPRLRAGVRLVVALLLSGAGALALVASPARAEGVWSDADLAWCETTAAPSAPSPALDDTCESEVALGTFSPSIKWQWDTNATHSGYVDLMMTPVVGNLSDDDGDGDIDEDDVPDVVVNAYSGDAYSTYGALVAMSGDDGSQEWSVRSVSYKGSTWYIGASAGVALGDLEGDGSPDVCTLGYGGDSLICLEHDGTVKWAVATSSAVGNYDAPAIADLDNDGEAEVIVGGIVYDTDGTKLWTGTGSFCFAINLDSDTALEVVCGGYAYDTDGTKLFGAIAGFSAAGDFDDDGEPELAVVASNYVYLLDTDGTTLWSTRVYSPGGYTTGGGPPTVADFDGDNKVEIGIAGSDAYTVYDTDGSRLWYHTIVDTSSRVTGSSVFDFDADGSADVLYADHYTFYVFDGPTGEVKYSHDGHASGTLYEYPVVADVDDDGSSDILVASTNMWWSGWQGVTVLSDSSWQPSRPVWNQHTYSITNINDDLSVPSVVDDNWLSYNNFRTAAPNWGDTNWQVDLAPVDPEFCYADCASPAVHVWVPVTNDGLAEAVSYTVSFVREDGTTALSTTEALTSSGEGEVLGPFTITEEMWGDGDLSVILTPAEGRTDCDETDNTVDLGAWPYPSLDGDGDGHAADACGGDDCDDADETTYGGADELGDDVDNDCDGLADDGLDRDGDGLTTEGELDLGTDPMDDDTDDDGLMDGSEVGSTDPLSGDSDGDGLGDGTESGLSEPEGDDTGDAFVPDADPSTTTDPSDADTDDDGLMDGSEDVDADGATDRGETDATEGDSDGDGVGDGTESGLSEPESDDTADGFVPDADPSTTTDPLDDDSDDDGLMDGTEDADQDGATGDDETDANEADSDGDGLGDGTESGLAWPEGLDTDGGFTPDADPSTTTDPLDDDSDDDGLLDGTEDGDGDGAQGSTETDPGDADSDGDGVGDGTESGLEWAEGEDTGGGFTPDADPSTTTDPLDDDSDDDGLLDGTEDGDGDGAQGSRETDASDADSDGDGVADGTEGGLTEPQGEDTDEGGFVPDADPSTTTDPLDDDSDDDGLMDGTEDSDDDGAVADGETDPGAADSDRDGVADGTESGASAPEGDDTDTTVFVPDADPSTTTDPTDDDSDDDGLIDGTEDGDGDGAASERETDPADADTDGDGVQDGTETGLGAPQGVDTDGGVFVPDADPSTSTDPLDADTDDGSVSDGAEDHDADGAVDEGECDPLDPSDDAACTGDEPDTADTADTGTPDTGGYDTGAPLDGKAWYEGGGCGCATTPSGSRAGLAALALGLGLVVTRRRRT